MYKFMLFLLTSFLFLVNIDAQSLYRQDSIVEVKIYFKEHNWLHLLDSLKENRTDERLEGTVFVNGKEYEESGIRFKGNSSFHSVQRSGDRKYPFNIKTTHEHKKHKLPGGYTRLKLANGFRDPSLIREVISYEIARKYMPASQSNFAEVYVNDEYFGIYTSSEPVDKAFLKNHFGSHKGILFKCDPNWRAKRPEYCPEGHKSSLNYLGNDSLCYEGLYELKSDHGWAELMKLTEVLKKNPDTIEQLLDVNQTLWLMAFNNVIINLDSYLGAFCHNFYLYQDTFGVFHPIVWDLNLAFGGFTLLNEKTVLSNEKMQKLSMFTNYTNEHRPLLSVLLKNDLYRKIYVANIKTIVEENFSDSTFFNRLDELSNSIAPKVEKDSNRLYALENFTKNLTESVDANGFNIIGIKELMSERVKYIQNHPLMLRENPEVAEVKLEEAEEHVRFNVSVKGAQQVYICYRQEQYYNFQRQPMIAGEVAEDENYQMWEIELPKEAVGQYYIIAEGEKAATLAPRRAAQEFYSIQQDLAQK